MSSNDDKEAQDAKFARLEALLVIQRERYDSKIKELEQKNAELELYWQLAAIRLQDRTTRPWFAESSNLALQTEAFQLRQENAAKDKKVSQLCALLRNCQASLTAVKQGFIALNKGLHETTEDLSTVVQDIDNALEAGTAFKELQSRASSTVADTAAGPSQPSSSASRSEKTTADTAAGPPQPSSSATKPEKVATSTSPTSTISSTPDYVKTLKSPAVKMPRLPRGRVPLEQSPLFARLPVTHADLADKREAADQTRSEPDKRQFSQKPNKAFKRGRSTRSKDARRRGDTKGQRSPRPDKIETSHESTSNRQSPLTNFQHPGSESTQATMPGSLEGKAVSQSTNTTAGSNQPPNNPKVKSSVVTPATQTRRENLANEDKIALSNPSPAPTARRRRKVKLPANQLAGLLRFGYEIPSETDSDDDQEAESEAVAPPVSATPQSPQPRITEDVPQSLRSITNSDSGIGLSGAATADIKPARSRQIQPAVPLEIMKPDRPVQQPETSDSGLSQSSAAQILQEPSSNVRKRMADEGQLGTSASSKRLRST